MNNRIIIAGLLSCLSAQPAVCDGVGYLVGTSITSIGYAATPVARVVGTYGAPIVVRRGAYAYGAPLVTAPAYATTGQIVTYGAPVMSVPLGQTIATRSVVTQQVAAPVLYGAPIVQQAAPLVQTTVVQQPVQTVVQTPVAQTLVQSPVVQTRTVLHPPVVQTQTLVQTPALQTATVVQTPVVQTQTVLQTPVVQSTQTLVQSPVIETLLQGQTVGTVVQTHGAPLVTLPHPNSAVIVGNDASYSFAAPYGTRLISTQTGLGGPMVTTYPSTFTTPGQTIVVR